MPKTTFARFLAPCEGHIVARYGVPRTSIGPGITALTADEAERYRHEYNRAVADKGVRECTEDEWLAQCEAEEARGKEAAEAAAATPTKTTGPTEPQNASGAPAHTE